MQKPFTRNMKLVEKKVKEVMADEVEGKTTDGEGPQAPQLTEDLLKTLMTIESNAQQFINVDLPQAQKALKEAQDNLFRVESAVQGAEVMIGRELQKAGVDVPTYLAQKKKYLESNSGS